MARSGDTATAPDPRSQQGRASLPETRGYKNLKLLGGFMEPDIFLFVAVFITSALSFICGAIMAHYMDLH